MTDFTIKITDQFQLETLSDLRSKSTGNFKTDEDYLQNEVNYLLKVWSDARIDDTVKSAVKSAQSGDLTKLDKLASTLAAVSVVK